LNPRFLSAVLLALVASMLLMGSCANDPPRPNVLLVLVDALRADHLGCYGYDRDTSPFLDQFAGRGVRFENAFAQGSQTKVSMASMLTGLNPPTTKVRTASFRDQADTIRSDRLSDKVFTLAEILRTGGYETVGFVTNPHLQDFQGFGQGFDFYQYTLWSELQAEDITRKALDWLDARPVPDEPDPFFMYLHFMDVHDPYDPPEPWRGKYVTGSPDLEPIQFNGPAEDEYSAEHIAYSMALYDGQINYWDDSFRELITGLEDQGLLDNTLVVVVSDHGDEFNEHGGFGHGFTVYDEMIHVPLIMVWPGRLSAGERPDLVRLVDMTPTVAGLTGCPLPPIELDGVDLFDKKLERGSRPVYSETFNGQRPRGLRTSSEQIIHNYLSRHREYFDLAVDPGGAGHRYQGPGPVSEDG